MIIIFENESDYLNKLIFKKGYVCFQSPLQLTPPTVTIFNRSGRVRNISTLHT